MIELTINGVARTFPHSLNCAELVTALALAGKRIAIERNGDIVPRSAYPTCLLANGDHLEIVVAVGGG